MTRSQTITSDNTSAPGAPQGRAQFGSRFGFLMAAAGAAVGLGNVWSFPSMAANNGGGAFLLVYVLMAFLLAYPALMAELMLGRYSQAGVIVAMGRVGGHGARRSIGRLIGFAAVCVATLGLTFYAIVTAWLVTYALGPVVKLVGVSSIENWLEDGGVWRDWWLALVIMGMTVSVVLLGVNKGIERWTKRLMPALIVTILLLIGITMTLDGAAQGLVIYLVPDFSKINAQLMVDAMGQAFFSLSIGIGAMVVYGSYLSRKANLPKIGAQVMFIDMGIAFIAGLLIVPALYVAQSVGVEVINEQGELTSSATLLFDVMPAMFDRLGALGGLMEVLFFSLLAVAALTSMFPALEVPVSALEETGRMRRRFSTILIAGIAFIGSTLILMNFDLLFEFVINLTINSMPVIAALTCLYVGWLLSRNAKLEELRKGAPEIEQGLFWKIWPWYIRVACPLLIVVVTVNSLT